jgi:hypothetical protein
MRMEQNAKCGKDAKAENPGLAMIVEKQGEF